MKVLEIPFNKFLGIQNADDEEAYIFKLEPEDKYLNHLGTIHAGAIFALAEASSGEYLLNQFRDYDLNIIPVVRKVEIKFSKPANGAIYSTASIMEKSVDEIVNELSVKQRTLIKVKVDVFSENKEKVFTSIFDWFIAQND